MCKLLRHCNNAKTMSLGQPRGFAASCRFSRLLVHGSDGFLSFEHSTRCCVTTNATTSRYHVQLPLPAPRRPPPLELVFLTANAKQLWQVAPSRSRHLAEANPFAKTPLGQCQPTQTLNRSEVQKCGPPQKLSWPAQNEPQLACAPRTKGLPPSHRQQCWHIHSRARSEHDAP